MDNSAEVQEFLTSRRSRIAPGQVGLPSTSRRRVSGLRRGEVAQLANLSIEYYSRLERGNLKGVSDSILLGIAHALLLNATETEHLFNLARIQNASRSEIATKTGAPVWAPQPSLQWMLDGISDAPAILGNNRNELVGTNLLGRALYSQLIASSEGQPNFAKFLFLNPIAHDFYPEWEVVADDMVGNLRIESSRHPNDKVLQSLIGELAMLSGPFRKKWANHEVRHFGSGTKRFFHPVVGELLLNYQTFDFKQDLGLGLGLYAAAPGSDSEERLKLLSLWARTELEARNPLFATN